MCVCVCVCVCGGIFVTVQQLVLTEIFTCRIDYLNIMNGITEVGYCADQLTGRDLLVSGNYVVLTFHTDRLLEKKRGFEILFLAQEISGK